MELYSSVDIIFPQTLWLPGAGEMYLILSAIGSFLEKQEWTTPEYEYLNTCDLYNTDRPDSHAEELYTRIYLNVISHLNGRSVIDARITTRANCLVLEMLCNPRNNTISYPFPPL
jgi:hypothetical protein